MHGMWTGSTCMACGHFQHQACVLIIGAWLQVHLVIIKMYQDLG